MKIKCIKNKINLISDDIIKKYPISSDQFFISERKEYIVYALCTYKGYAWYCICDDVYLFFPTWYPFFLFDVVDHRLSRYWIVSLDEDNNKKVPFLSFPEWSNDSFFYGELVDGNGNDPNALIFKRYKEIMDLEFPDLNINNIARIGDEDWLICPNCLDAWKSLDILNALVKCANCKNVVNNPRYKDQSPPQ